MVRTRNTFCIPARLLPQLQSFAREECEQSVERGTGAVLLIVDSREGMGVDAKFHVRLIGSGRAKKQLRTLCVSAEEGRMKYPQPINPNSRPVGQLGETIDAEVHLYSMIDFDSMFGHTYIYRFRDSFGNELSWRTTSSRTHKKGHYVLKGKVKEHASEGGTIVTRIGYVALKEKTDA